MKFEFLFKGKLAENGLSMAKFAEEIGTSPQNLTQRVKRGAISYEEAAEFEKKLGYSIEWVKQKD